MEFILSIYLSIRVSDVGLDGMLDMLDIYVYVVSVLGTIPWVHNPLYDSFLPFLPPPSIHPSTHPLIYPITSLQSNPTNQALDTAKQSKAKLTNSSPAYRCGAVLLPALPLPLPCVTRLHVSCIYIILQHNPVPGCDIISIACTLARFSKERCAKCFVLTHSVRQAGRLVGKSYILHCSSLGKRVWITT